MNDHNDTEKITSTSSSEESESEYESSEESELYYYESSEESELEYDLCEKDEKIKSIDRREGGGLLTVCIKTNIQTITLSISDESQCCERWGVDIYGRISKYIESDLLGISGLSEIKELGMCGEGSKVKLTLLTSVGKLVLCAWNKHNGYYCHNVYARYNNKYENVSI